MKKYLLSFASTAMLLLVGTSVRADQIPWAYSAVSPTAISASTSPLSSIAFSGSTGNPHGPSGIIIYTVTASSFASESSPDSFSNVPFNLSVKLTDINSTFSGSGTVKTTDTVNFAGLFNATNVTPKSMLPGINTWTMVAGNASPTSATVILGADDTGWHKYQVDLTSFTSPGQPGGAAGSIQAVVNITPTEGPGGSGEVNGTPEPTSLVLAGLGFPLLVLVRRRLKKAQSDTTIA